MDLLIHDLAAACERDAAEGYDEMRPMLHHPARSLREPTLRLRSGRVDADRTATPLPLPFAPVPADD